MAKTTFTIDGVPFGGLNDTAGRKAMEIRVGAPQHAVKSFHPEGVDGNFIVFGGRIGRPIMCFIRYIDTLANCLTNFNADCEQFAGKLLTIVDDNGVSRENCRLLAMYKSRRERAIGRGGLVYYDAIALFNQE